MSDSRIEYLLARAEEEDLRAETSETSVVRATHAAFAAAYREFAARLQEHHVETPRAAFVPREERRAA